mgnify:CR=1 FL=1
MKSSISKLTKENEDLINSMTSMELFNFLDKRYRDMYDKKIFPKPSEVRAKNRLTLLQIIFSITWSVFFLISVFEIPLLTYPLFILFGIFYILTDFIPFIQNKKKGRNKLFNTKRLLKIADIQYEKGMSFYLSKEYEVLREGTLF